MTTPPFVSITDELISELDTLAGDDFPLTAIDTEVLRALLAERAGLIKDRERLDWLADIDSPAEVLLPAQCVTDNIHSMRDAIDAAMKS